MRLSLILTICGVGIIALVVTIVLLYELVWKPASSSGTASGSGSGSASGSGSSTPTSVFYLCNGGTQGSVPTNQLQTSDGQWISFGQLLPDHTIITTNSKQTLTFWAAFNLWKTFAPDGNKTANNVGFTQSETTQMLSVMDILVAGQPVTPTVSPGALLFLGNPISDESGVIVFTDVDLSGSPSFTLTGSNITMYEVVSYIMSPTNPITADRLIACGVSEGGDLIFYKATGATVTFTHNTSSKTITLMPKTCLPAAMLRTVQYNTVSGEYLPNDGNAHSTQAYDSETELSTLCTQFSNCLGWTWDGSQQQGLLLANTSAGITGIPGTGKSFQTRSKDS